MLPVLCVSQGEQAACVMHCDMFRLFSCHSEQIFVGSVEFLDLTGDISPSLDRLQLFRRRLLTATPVQL